MKIYFRPNPYSRNCVHVWTQHVQEQIIETVEWVYDKLMENEFEDSHNIPFPSFYQPDIHTRFVIRNDEKFQDDMYYYVLFFEWEPEDFLLDEEDLDDCDIESPEKNMKGAKSQYAEFCDNVGIDVNYHDAVPEEFVYIGSYRAHQKEPISLPGLVFLPEVEVLDGCMYLSVDPYER